MSASVTLRSDAGQAVPRHAGPPEVLAATALPMIHHRSADFRAAFERVLGRLAEVYRTQNDVLLFTSAGTAAMESAVANLCSPGDRVLCVSHGYFGERWAEIAEGYGLDVDHVRYEWGETPNPDEVGARLEEIGGAKVVYLTHSDTSTGGSPTFRPRPRASRAPARSSPSTPSRASRRCRSRPTSGASTWS